MAHARPHVSPSPHGEELSQEIILLPKMLLTDWRGWDGNLACDLSLLLPINALLPEEHQLGLLQGGAVAQNQNDRDGSCKGDGGTLPRLWASGACNFPPSD